MTNDIKSNELTTVINEMLVRITNVANMVDQVFPDKGVGASVKECGDKLKEYVDLLSLKANGIDLLDLESMSTDDLTKMAVKDYKETYKLIETLRSSAQESPEKAKAYEVYCAHARGTLDIILKHK